MNRQLFTSLAAVLFCGSVSLANDPPKSPDVANGKIIEKHVNEEGMVTDFLVGGRGSSTSIDIAEPNAMLSNKICRAGNKRSPVRVFYRLSNRRNVFAGFVQTFGN